MTVIASTDERFSDFAPYVASLNDENTVAFQAALRGGGTGVFSGDGRVIAEISGSTQLGGVTSHPDLNGSGDTCFYGEFADGGQGVFLLRDGRLRTVASTYEGFANVGPLGPTMNEKGMVAFRAERVAGRGGVFVGDSDVVVTVADTEGGWREFHGLPVIDGSGTVVFRADREDGVHGIYRGHGGTIEPIAETGDVFESLALFPSANESGAVAFAANLRGGGAGIFTANEDQIVQVIDTEDVFDSLRGALISGAGEVVISGTPRGGSRGLFAGPDADADRILALGDTLRGSSVEDLAANTVSVNTQGHVAVRATLADGRQLILRADRTH